MHKVGLILLLAAASIAQVVTAQVPRSQEVPPVGDAQPIFRVTVVERTSNAVSYRHRSGWTKVDLRGTPLAPDASGHADVNSRPGYIEVKTEMHKLLPASQYGPEFLTYVLWA
ncbi:MAG: OmpA family protein, partial [Bryobacteraceae bacterium]